MPRIRWRLVLGVAAAGGSAAAAVVALAWARSPVRMAHEHLEVQEGCAQIRITRSAVEDGIAYVRFTARCREERLCEGSVVVQKTARGRHVRSHMRCELDDALCTAAVPAYCTRIGDKYSEENLALSLSYYERACAGAHAGACRQAARMLLEGAGRSDEAEGRALLGRACALGSPEACADLTDR
jgi:TPR repeat protein